MTRYCCIFSLRPPPAALLGDAGRGDHAERGPAGRLRRGGPYPTSTLVGNSLWGSPSRSLRRIGPPAKGTTRALDPPAEFATSVTVGSGPRYSGSGIRLGCGCGSCRARPALVRGSRGCGRIGCAGPSVHLCGHGLAIMPAGMLDGPAFFKSLPSHHGSLGC
jgi:hypothetical protein